MGIIYTTYGWRCPNCGRIFQDSSYDKLKKFVGMHKKSCAGKSTVYESKGSPPQKYFGIS